MTNNFWDGFGFGCAAVAILITMYLGYKVFTWKSFLERRLDENNKKKGREKWK